jgi:hypothetical protein
MRKLDLSQLTATECRKKRRGAAWPLRPLHWDWGAPNTVRTVERVASHLTLPHLQQSTDELFREHTALGSREKKKAGPAEEARVYKPTNYTAAELGAGHRDHWRPNHLSTG